MSKTTQLDQTGPTVTIHRLAELPNAELLVAGIEAVFFAASHTQTFESDEVRAAFRERWLGRYLNRDPQWVYVALKDNEVGATVSDNVVGYLVGALEDPALRQQFSDLGYFQVFKPQTCKFPAQLHVNLARHVRGYGVGGRLIEAFIGDARQHGTPGVHVVTGAEARNVGFYNRSGFEEMARTDWNDHTIVFLGRAL